MPCAQKTSLGKPGGKPGEIREPAFSSAWVALDQLRRKLGDRANSHQHRTLATLQSVLLFHLAASSMAAIGATILIVDSRTVVVVAWLYALTAFALVKPALAFSAFVLERRLHGGGNREGWLHARVLEEMVRGALATWPLPIPADANAG